MRFARCLSASIIVLFLLNSCSHEKTDHDLTSTSTLSFVQSQGKRLVNETGEEVILKGTNLGNWLVPEGYMFKMDQVNSPRKIDELLYELIGPDSLTTFWHQYLDNYITHEDIKYLKRIGCNHIRLPFHYKLFTDDLYMGKRNAGFEYMDRVVDWCREEGMYVLLDMHCAPGGQTGDNIDDSHGYPFLMKSSSSQQLLTDIWIKIAQRYKNESIIVGYDIMNEPIAHYFESEAEILNDRLYSIYQRIVRDIRKVDKEHLIFLNGSRWATDFSVFKNTLGDNIVYEFHKYWFDVNQSAIQEYLDFRDLHQVPIYIGETGENTDEWIEQFRTLLDEHNIGWCFWPYKKMNNTRGIMNFDEPEYYRLISEYARSKRSTYKEIRENRTDSIAWIQQALNQFNTNSLYQNNLPNQGYCSALGFKSAK